MQFQTHLSRSSSSRFTTSSRPHLTQTPRLRPLTSPMHSLSIPGSSISSSSMAAEQQKQRRGSLVTARWGASAVVLGLSLLVSLPWEQLDHHFPYEKVEVPDVGPQDRPRWRRECVSHRHACFVVWQSASGVCLLHTCTHGAFLSIPNQPAAYHASHPPHAFITPHFQRTHAGSHAL